MEYFVMQATCFCYPLSFYYLFDDKWLKSLFVCIGLYLYPLTTNEFLNVYESFSGKNIKKTKSKRLK